MKQEMTSYLSTIQSEIRSLCEYLYNNPEESYKEKNSSNYICNLLQNHNFIINTDYMNIPNSFIAQKGNGHPKICYLCEYDSVQNYGHITGHNALTSISVSASIALGLTVEKLQKGSVILIGCPGEYLGGTKNILVKQNAFEDIDVVMECHPYISTHSSGTSQSISALKIIYKSNHGLAFLNEHTFTSLDALQLTLNILNSISKSFSHDVTINYVITKGGTSPSIIPEECEAQVYIRSSSSIITTYIEDKVRNITSYVQSLTGVNSDIYLYEPPSEELITNKTLDRLFCHNLKETGIIDINSPININSGLSIGIVSKVVPCIHPYIQISSNSETEYGTTDFAKCTLTDYAYKQIEKSALALAFTGYDIIQKDSLLNEIRTEFYCK
ncbi:M20 family peptidase [Clostridium sp. MSJ-8]|uniref:peptidase dimerization domain-containing protein n=1 Tax=Clostridium sp. MSJ-8 TaxID=2841510 RepID=UPI001C0EDD35|nr:peptidase dimerization domain-containing protein [Clostridium sp. MSJ-8]MBU5487202.1 M20 family peptidase [Clostridium sp. MSJ-8]